MNQIEFKNIEKLKEIIIQNNCENIFLLTGKKSYEDSGAKRVIDLILKNMNVTHINDFDTNPTLKDAKRIVQIFKGSKYDLIIAIGGGSVIDMAKLVNVFTANNDKPIKLIKKETLIINKGLPFVAIPTTSGTGSEATHFAVIYVNKIKYSLADQKMLPDYVILDSTFTLNLPKKISASTGLDALSQAVESYWAVGATNKSKEYASQSIKLIVKYFVDSVNNPSKENKEKILEASNLAGKAINISKTTAPHAISYSFTSFFGVPHGHAVGLTLGKILLFNYDVSDEDCQDSKGPEFVKGAILKICSYLGVKTPLEAKKKLIE